MPSVFIQPRSAWHLHWHHFKNILLYCTYFYNTRALVKYNSSLDNDFVKIFSKSLKLQPQRSVSMIRQWQSYSISTPLTFLLMLVALLIATFIFFSYKTWKQDRARVWSVACWQNTQNIKILQAWSRNNAEWWAYEKQGDTLLIKHEFQHLNSKYYFVKG